MPAPLIFDQLRQGDQFALGAYRMTRDEVIAFAAQYDPQPFHLDDEAGAANPVFGRLSASGWHTVMVMYRLMDKYWKERGLRNLAGAGVDAVRWLAPVYPDDLLTGTVEVIMARPSASRADAGIMTAKVVLHNQHDRKVATMQVTALFERD
ncbi:MAG: MaoC/PaaZ C-terminal domain-containing protein [Sphingomonadaceae bacterium]